MSEFIFPLPDQFEELDEFVKSMDMELKLVTDLSYGSYDFQLRIDRGAKNILFENGNSYEYLINKVKEQLMRKGLQYFYVQALA